LVTDTVVKWCSVEGLELAIRRKTPKQLGVPAVLVNKGEQPGKPQLLQVHKPA